VEGGSTSAWNVEWFGVENGLNEAGKMEFGGESLWVLKVELERRGRLHCCY